jgi:predicted dehydrogenase
MSEGKNRARIGFIGAGWWATSNHMPLFQEREDVELVAVCRLGQRELQQVKDAFDFEYATEDYHDLLDNCDLDGVVVASPHTLHYEHARAALERGLHVMCEKPMTILAEHARELVRIADEKNAHLLVPYGWNYKPYIQQAKRLMDETGIGTIEYALCHMASPIRGLLSGEGMKMDEVSGQAGGTLFSPDPATWADPHVAGGGYGHAQISHSSGLMFWLSGLEAETVFSMMTAPGAEVDLFDAASVRFRTGAIGTISGAGAVPAHRPFHMDIRLFGTEGMFLLDAERARLELRRHDGNDVVVDVAPDAGEYECSGPAHNFADLILGKTSMNWSPGWAAMRSVEMLDAAYRSAISGRAEPV